MAKMIKWTTLVKTVHKQLIASNVSLLNASVGEFEFGGLQVTSNVLCSVNAKTGALLILDKAALPKGVLEGHYTGKAGLDWFTFTNHIENLCASKDILPSEVRIDHLEVREIHCVSELSIFIDTTYKTLSITDTGQRINGTNLADIIKP